MDNGSTNYLIKLNSIWDVKMKWNKLNIIYIYQKILSIYNENSLYYVKLTDQLIQNSFEKSGHTGGKWLIYSTKHHNDN